MIYRFLNLISVDVACGAMACAAMFASVFQVQILPQGYASLGLTVWIIYTADHLLDAWRLNEKASTERHRFHQKNFYPLVILLMIAVIGNLILIGFIRKPIVEAGLVVAIIVSVYLLVQQNLKSFKETAVAILYSCGVLLPALSLNKNHVSPEQWVIIAIFFITVFINLILFSWYDLEQDQRDHHTSFVVMFGESRTRIVLLILFLNQALLLMLAVFLKASSGAILILGCMNGMMAILLYNPDWFRSNDRYRLFGDGIFLFPLIFLVAP